MDDLGGLFIGSWCLRALAESIADCNANNRPDDCDIAEGFSLDVNHNGKPDECEPCLFDLDGDGAIGGGDLAILLGSWGNSPGPADVNGDGSVDGKDLSLVLSAWADVAEQRAVGSSNLSERVSAVSDPIVSRETPPRRSRARGRRFYGVGFRAG